MTRTLLAACTLTIGTASAWAAANPQLLRLLPPDSKAIAGIDVAHAKASALGQFMLTQSGPVADLDKLKAATGFDPRTDLLELVAASGLNNAGLAVGYGAFPVERLTALAQASGTPTSNYRGITLISAGPKAPIIGDGSTSAPTVTAFLDGSTVVLGTMDQVQAAIDRWIGGAAASGALMQKAVQVGAASDAWAVASSINDLTGAASSQVPQLSQEAAIARNIASKIETVSGALTLSDTNVVLHGELLTKTVQDAQALADVFQLFVGMAGPQATQNPMFSALQVAPKGTALNFTLTLTEQQAEDLLKSKRTTTAVSRGALLE